MIGWKKGKRAAAAFLGALGAFGGRAPAQYDLAAPRVVEMGASPFALASGDFDGDGRRDLAVAESGGVRIVFLRDDELLSSVATVEPASNPTVLAGGDADGDGLVDLLVAATGGVRLLYGDGVGGFVRANVLGLPVTFASAALVDVDGDGLLDAVSSTVALSSLLVSLQNAAAPRSFLAPTSVALPNGNVHLEAGDFDGDGFGDVAAFDRSAPAFRLHLGDGAGGFGPPLAIALPDVRSASAVADLDADGRDDLGVATRQGRIEVFRGDAALGLAAAPPVPLGPGAVASALELADSDGDGRVDFVAGLESGLLAFVPGDGLGGGGAPASVPLGYALSDLHAAPFVPGAALDLAFAARAAQVAGIVRGGNAFEAVKPLAVAKPTGVVAADFNADGLADLVAVGFSPALGDRASIFFGDGRGGLAGSGVALLRHPPSHLASADVDADGFPDLVISSGLRDRIMLLRGTGSGFADAGDVDEALNEPTATAVCDIDGDGALDIAAVARLGPAAHVLWGDGAGGFPARGDVDPGGSPIGVECVDWNGDALGDLLILRSVPPGLGLARQGPARTFSAAASLFETGSSPLCVAAADLDGDGAADVALGDANENRLRLAFGDGAGGVARLATVAIPGPARLVEALEVTGDGVVDLVVASTFGAAIVLAGDGRGGFVSPRAFAAGPSATALAALDWNGDRRTDLAVAASGADSIALLEFRDTPLTACLAGTVNAAGGAAAADVLFVNSRTGDFTRRLVFSRATPVAILVNRPPLHFGPAPFVLYLWRAAPSNATVRSLPGGLGRIALPMPLAPGSPAPLVVWNNAGRPGRLGAATQSSSPAPFVVVNRPQGFGVGGTFTLQGVIADPGAPNGRAAVTNGIVLEVR